MTVQQVIRKWPERCWPSFGVRDSLKNPLHFVGIRQSAPTVKEEEEQDISRRTRNSISRESTR